MNDAVPQPETVVEKTKPSKTRMLSGLALKMMGVVFLLLAFCLLYYGTIAYIAWRSGEQIRLTEIAAAQDAEMAKQFSLAEADVAAGRYELALRRLDWLLVRDSAYAGAAALQTEAQTQIAIALTPTATPSPTPSPTPTPTVDPDALAAIDTEAADAQIAAMADGVVRGRWETAISDLIQFQISYPSYRRQDTDKLLYDAYAGWGQYLLQNTDQIERGLAYLSQAQQLGDLTEEVEGEIVFAELYLEGIVFYAVNWEAYLYYFRELCTYAPTFQDSCLLLEEGLIAYGDQLAVALDWCPAVDHYREASRISFPMESSLPAKIEQAQTACLLATPTPAVITDTLPITNTVPTIP